jgi:hypothetical protein
MQLMQYLATNVMLLIVTNITQKFVLHMNTAVSEVTDIQKVLLNAMSKFQVMNYHSSDT